jgi:hypothetical protein
MLPKKQRSKSASCSSLTVPELDQSKIAVLNMLASAHSRRSYKHAIEEFMAWYCSEPRLGFNRSVVVRYRSFLESLSSSAATINRRCQSKHTLDRLNPQPGRLRHSISKFSGGQFLSLQFRADY